MHISYKFFTLFKFLLCCAFILFLLPCTGFASPEGEVLVQQMENEAEQYNGISNTQQYFFNSVLSPYLYFSYENIDETSSIPVENPTQEKIEYPVFLDIPQKTACGFHFIYDRDGYVSFCIPNTTLFLGIEGKLENGTEVVICRQKINLQQLQKDDNKEIEKIDKTCKWLIEFCGEETVMLRNAQDLQYVMTVDITAGMQKAKIVLNKENNQETQQFHLQDTVPYIQNTLQKQLYYVRTGCSNYMMLSIGDGIYNDERNAYIYMFDNGDGQYWTIDYDDYGLAVIHHNDSNKVLTVRNNDPVNSQSVGQAEYTGSVYQKWILESLENGGYRIRSAANIEKAITLNDMSLINYSPVSLYTVHDADDQYWFFSTEPIAGAIGEGYMNAIAQDYYSNTGYLLMIDNYSNHVGVYQGSQGNWQCIHYWNCVTGKASTPSPRGEFTVWFKQYSFDGNMDSPAWYTCYYCTCWYPDYFFHSIIYYQGTWKVLDGAMGVNASHGCIRLDTENALWIYENIPEGTKVVSY